MSLFTKSVMADIDYPHRALIIVHVESPMHPAHEYLTPMDKSKP